jgi:L-2-hydroxyglutarate oxidase LhgO
MAEAAVIGAGVVGLAVARALARRGRDVLVLESRSAIGTVTSSRNSEVVHAGIYYDISSSKARHCVRGRAMLYDFCENHAVAHARCGKLIVATSDSELRVLEAIRERAERNGVHDLRSLSAADAAALEPQVLCRGALLSPSTGIVDSHAFMLALQGEAEALSATIALNSRVESAEPVGKGGGWEVVVRDCSSDMGGDEDLDGVSTLKLQCQTLINCAGLEAPGLARRLAGEDDTARIPQAFYCKGNYYGLAAGTVSSPFSRLVYPVPQSAGLGVHATLDLGGQCRFGPDVEWVDNDWDYTVDPERSTDFYAEVRKYWPGLPDGALVPDYAGIRPKISATGADDFTVWTSPASPGLVQLFGIESPGLTGSLSLAEEVAENVERYVS